MCKAPCSIFITGASSGIGAALAVVYAKKGVTLGLVGRNAERLSKIAQECEACGATVITAVIDVADRKEMASILRQFDGTTPIDLLIANAGVGRNIEDSLFSRELVNTNIIGLLNTIEPTLDFMIGRRRGQIAIMSSLAAFRALGGPPGYAASKAWARLYGEALRGRLASKGVAVNVVCPGFVQTPMNKGGCENVKRAISASEAAEVIKLGLAENAARISFPRRASYNAWFLSMLPSWWTDRLIRQKLLATVKNGE